MNDHQDIADLKQEIARLQQEISCCRSIIASLPARILVKNSEDKILLCNNAEAKSHGLTPEAMEGKLYADFYPEDRGPLPPLGENLNNGNVWSDRAERSLDHSVNGKPVTMVLSDNITYYKKIENALKIRENRIKAILDTAAEGIITINAKGIIETFNPAAARIFGYATSEVVGHNVSMLMHHELAEQHDSYLSNYLKTGVSKIIGIGRDLVGRRKDGGSFPLHLSVGVVNLEPGVLFTGIVRDLTEYSQMREEVERSKRLAMIGEMAASIAHEIKNPLAGISAAMQVLCRKTPEEDSRHAIMQEVSGQVVRLSKSINELLMFAKHWSPNKRMCDLRETVMKVCRAAKMEEKFHGIHFNIPNDRPKAWLDTALFEQILWNLFQNSSDAVGKSGTIDISYKMTEDAVEICVSDNGSGIPPENQTKVLQPFFTTKTKGTGLGLAITQKIMESHDGAMHLKSTPDRGTSVYLTFPNKLY